jgi:cell division protein FtsB
MRKVITVLLFVAVVFIVGCMSFSYGVEVPIKQETKKTEIKDGAAETIKTLTTENQSLRVQVEQLKRWLNNYMLSEQVLQERLNILTGK